LRLVACRRQAQPRFSKVPAAKGSVSAVFKDVPYSDYAAKVFQDEN
jgi:uncharacterized protein (DUF2141 family)